jgi:hypothetical protein
VKVRIICRQEDRKANGYRKGRRKQEIEVKNVKNEQEKKNEEDSPNVPTTQVLRSWEQF